MAISAINAARDFAKNYLTQNPTATQENLQCEVRNYLQELRQNGTKISKNQIAQVNAQIGDIYKATADEIKASFSPVVTKKTETAVKSLNNAQAPATYPSAGWVTDKKADIHYDEFNGLSKKARQNLHKRNMADAKAAFADERFAEPVVETPSNNQNKKAANADYQSSKKQKQAKKQAEIKSQNEHKQNLPIKDKKVRKTKANLRYCTSNGIMTSDARKHFNRIAEGLNGKFTVSVNDAPNSTLQKMNEYYRELEVKLSAPVNVKPVTTPKPPVEVVTEVVSKTKGKGGKIGWIAAGVAAVLGIAGVYKNDEDKKAKQLQQEPLSQINNVA